MFGSLLRSLRGWTIILFLGGGCILAISLIWYEPTIPTLLYLAACCLAGAVREYRNL